MIKPVCIKCKRFYKPKRIGVRTLEQRPRGHSVKAGTIEEQNWVPYKVWSTDLYECGGCGNTIIFGSGMEPISIDYEKDFKTWVAQCSYTVNDC